VLDQRKSVERFISSMAKLLGENHPAIAFYSEMTGNPEGMTA
jgi:hypothetical protein